MEIKAKWLQDDEFFMNEAIKEANVAENLNEVPIGSVIVRNGEIVARGHNLREHDQQSIAHAELMAIKEACKVLGTWRLEECTLYVTLEPCPMCAGAIVQSRVKRVVFGAFDPKAGCCGSIMNLLDEPRFNHLVPISSGVLEEECVKLLKDFFKELREKKKQYNRE